MAENTGRGTSIKITFPTPSLADDILQAIQTLVIVINGEGEAVYISPSVQKILGYRVEEVLGNFWSKAIQLSGTDDLADLKGQLAKAARGDIPVPTSQVRTLLTKTGEERWIHWTGSKGPGDLLIASGQDITDLHHAEEEIERREKDFKAVFDEASDGMMILNSKWEYIDANPAAVSIVGLPLEEILGKKHDDLAKSGNQLLKLQDEALLLGRVSQTADFVRLDGERRHLEFTIIVNFRANHQLMMLRDITQRRLLELQLAQAQKLEAVGRLAGGVAHDFNNMLTAIRGYGELLIKKTPDGPHRKYLDGIIGATERASQTTQQLLAFGRRQVMQPKLLDVNRSVRDTTDLIRRVIGEDIELLTVLSNDAGNILVDPGQFGDVLMNLAVNARDAMPNGGKVIIETRAVHLDDDYVLRHIQVHQGDYVMLAITDTGMGIPPEIKPHIFEPFFTTKKVGEGSGLGLAMVYGVVKQSGGFIWVYSEPGEGTTFKLYFPQAASDSGPASVSSPSNILIIEDDEMVRSLAATILRDQGHFVLEAVDGSRALAACEQFDEQLDLVITDMTAPGMSGDDLIGYFAVRYPAVTVVYMSGFPKVRLAETNPVLKRAIFLPKPFSVKQLLDVVDRALEPKNVSPLT